MCIRDRFWTDGKRNPLDITSVGQVYFFDGPCTATSDEPVSYTHLDVYKRQPQDPSESLEASGTETAYRRDAANGSLSFKIQS